MVVLQLEAIVCILKSSSSKRSVKCIYKTIANLETRNKLIKKADKSPSGWKTVEEYMLDSLASASEGSKA